MEYPRAAGCLLAYLSATSNPADTFKLHALSDKTYLIRHADTFHFLTPLRFSKGGDCSAGTYGRRGCSTPGRLPRRHRLRSLGPTSRMRGRRQCARPVRISKVDVRAPTVGARVHHLSRQRCHSVLSAHSVAIKSTIHIGMKIFIATRKISISVSIISSPRGKNARRHKRGPSPHQVCALRSHHDAGAGYRPTGKFDLC